MPIGTGYVGIAKETTFGVAVAPTTFVPVKSAEANTDPQNYYPEEIRASRAMNKVVPMGRTHEASLEMDAEPVNLGHFLLAALGSINTTSLSGTPAAYSHVFTPANDLPSYTIEMNDTAMIRRVSGAKCDTLSISVEAGSDGVLTVESSWLAQTIADQASAATPSYGDKQPFSFTSVEVQKGGSAATNVRSFELEIENNLKDDHFVLGTSRDVAQIPVGMRNVTGSVEIYFESKADYQSFLAGGKDSLKLTFTGAIISGANRESLIIELPYIQYDAFEVPMDGPDEEVIASLEFTAIYDATSAFDIKATLISDVSTY